MSDEPAKAAFNADFWVWGEDETRPRVLHTMLRVKDFEASIRFYCDTLGMDVLDKFDVTVRRATGVFMSQEASDALMAAGLHPRQHKDGPRLISVGYEEPSFVFLTRTDTLLALGNDAPRAAAPGQAMIVEERERKTLDRSLAARGWVFAPSGPPARGIDYSNGDFVSLQPGRVVSVSSGTAPEDSPEAPPPQ